MRSGKWIAGICITYVSLGPAFAQVGRISPHETTSEMLDGKVIHITYGRPFLRGRKLIGNLIKYGQMWRTGADEAPVLFNEGRITIGDLDVPPGRYSLFTIPGKEKWTLVINREPDHMGTLGYNRKKDLGRVEMDIKPASQNLEIFTIEIRVTSQSTGVLEMAWGTVFVHVPISANRVGIVK